MVRNVTGHSSVGVSSDELKIATIDNTETAKLSLFGAFGVLGGCFCYLRYPLYLAPARPPRRGRSPGTLARFSGPGFRQSGGGAQDPDLLKVKIRPATGLQPLGQGHRPETDPDQPAHLHALGFPQAADLAVAPLAQHHMIPMVGALAAGVA